MKLFSKNQHSTSAFNHNGVRDQIHAPSLNNQMRDQICETKVFGCCTSASAGQWPRREGKQAKWSRKVSQLTTGESPDWTQKVETKTEPSILTGWRRKFQSWRRARRGKCVSEASARELGREKALEIRRGVRRVFDWALQGPACGRKPPRLQKEHQRGRGRPSWGALTGPEIVLFR